MPNKIKNWVGGGGGGNLLVFFHYRIFFSKNIPGVLEGGGGVWGVGAPLGVAMGRKTIHVFLDHDS